MKSNTRIDRLITTARWAIDEEWGFSQLLGYFDELEFAEKFSLQDLKYQERKAQSQPYIIAGATIFDDGDLSNSSIPDGSVAVINMSGVMQLEDSLSTRGVKSLAGDFRSAYANPKIKAIVFRPNSGGGELLAGQELYNVIGEKNKPVYVVADFLASAALLGVLQADKIYASGVFTKVGSVGVVVSINKLALEGFKENVVEIYAKQSSLKNIEWRELLNGNEKPLVEMLSGDAQEFIDLVKKHRPNVTSDTVGKGALVGATEGIQLGLLDGLQTFGSLLDTISNSSTNKLNIMSFYDSAKAHLTRIFGWNLEGKTEDDVVGLLAAEKSFAELKGEIHESVTTLVKGQIDAFTSDLAAANKKIEDLTAQANTAEGNTKKIDDLTAQLKASDDKRTALEKEVADLKVLPKTGATEQPGTHATAGEKFHDILEKAVVEGDSKY